MWRPTKSKGRFDGAQLSPPTPTHANANRAAQRNDAIGRANTSVHTPADVDTFATEVKARDAGRVFSTP